MRRGRNKPSRSPLAFQVLVVVFVIGMTYILYRSRVGVAPNFCPIDGHLAESVQRLNPRWCSYSHYSDIEKTTHTWTDRCR
jgi:hypothetical protein